MDLKTYIKSLNLPGAISAFGLLSAWMAILLLLKGDLKLSVILAGISFFIDSLDGHVARRMNNASELGRQLDSMVDVIAYSVYSALITSQVLLPGIVGMIVGYSIILFGILRLIRFNVDGYLVNNSNRYYRGIVVCHLSLASVGFLILSKVIHIPSLLIAITLVSLAVLQISNIKTRKTGMLPFWFLVAIILGIGAILWLP